MLTLWSVIPFYRWGNQYPARLSKLLELIKPMKESRAFWLWHPWAFPSSALGDHRMKPIETQDEMVSQDSCRSRGPLSWPSIWVIKEECGWMKSQVKNVGRGWEMWVTLRNHVAAARRAWATPEGPTLETPQRKTEMQLPDHSACPLELGWPHR